MDLIENFKVEWKYFFKFFGPIRAHVKYLYGALWVYISSMVLNMGKITLDMCFIIFWINFSLIIARVKI